LDYEDTVNFNFIQESWFEEHKFCPQTSRSSGRNSLFAEQPRRCGIGRNDRIYQRKSTKIDWNKFDISQFPGDTQNYGTTQVSIA
jgi:hypothetical protein